MSYIEDIQQQHAAFVQQFQKHPEAVCLSKFLYEEIQRTDLSGFLLGSPTQSQNKELMGMKIILVEDKNYNFSFYMLSELTEANNRLGADEWESISLYRPKPSAIRVANNPHARPVAPPEQLVKIEVPRNIILAYRGYLLKGSAEQQM